MTQWENLPQPLPERPAVPVTASWSGFSADPRQPANRGLRASDADRDFATRLLEQARLDGRLDAGEQGGRAAQVAVSRTLGELVPLVSDVMVAGASPAPRRPDAGWMRGWVGLALLFNAIWLMTCLTAGRLLYYWPMWPMLGTGIPVLMGLMWGGTPGSSRQDGRRDRRNARRDRRNDRRGRHHGDGPAALPPGPSDDLR